MRSVSTTPRSVRGTDPDDYDRVMGVSSVGPQETVRFGEGDATDIAGNREGVANNSGNTDETEKEPPLTQQHQFHTLQVWRMILVVAETRGLW